MKPHNNREADALIIVLRETSIIESEEVGPGVIIDPGRDGEIVRLEILDASRRVDDIHTVDLPSD